MIGEVVSQGFITGIYDFGRPAAKVEVFKNAVDELAKHDAAAHSTVSFSTVAAGG